NGILGYWHWPFALPAHRGAVRRGDLGGIGNGKRGNNFFFKSRFTWQKAKSPPPKSLRRPFLVGLYLVGEVKGTTRKDYGIAGDHESHEQGGAVQLSVHFQRHTFLAAADLRSAGRIDLLKAGRRPGRRALHASRVPKTVSI